ncbi:cation:proton antiporter [uncultured Clostridium sp.]|uniref:cation:proton antiporter n=1 Tax=uncultured Clostridium sp. TaxID=59620 RepID=UPI0028EDA9A1|nr:cation:proton antiporter [uncultured Clostridium sp.]
MDLLLKISIVLFVGVIGGRLAKYLKLPNVTGYLVAGLFIGASFLGIINEQDMTSFSIVNEVALAAIAFSIGSEFLLKDMLKVGKSVLIITLAEAIGAVILVFLVTYYVFNQSFPFSIVIASMSAATAPAATMMVIRQYKAHGPLTKTILPVVAIDDAVGIMLFGLAMSLAKISIGSTSHSFLQMISAPLIEILGSLLLGFLLGVVLTFLANKSKSKEELLSIVLAAIAASTGLANLLKLSPLLTCMMLGATLVNLMHNSNRVFTLITDFTPPIYLLFFTLAGASLNLSVLAQVGALGIGYIIARAIGKMLGAFLGAKSVNADDAVVKYLGLSLLPQGGVSIGLSIIVRQELPQFAAAITTVILFSVLVYEISGPILAKIAIEKAGEVNGLKKVAGQAC